MSDQRSRRQFLTMAGAAAAATLLSSRFGSSVARASSPTPPLRLIAVMSPYQMSEPFFHPQVSTSSSARLPRAEASI